MRISDWSSDVCSSDLGPCAVGLESTVLDLSGARAAILRPGSITTQDLTPLIGEVGEAAESGGGGLKGPGMLLSHYAQIGRASCRERGCKYVYIAVVAVS